MEAFVGWLAPAATMVAAVMTAANLGARVTGWGFVVFAAASVAWIAVGALGGQTNLVVTNGFLLAVNAVGVWRWLGRRARVESAAAEVEARTGTLVAATKLVGRAVVGPGGDRLASLVEVMADGDSGRLAQFVVEAGAGDLRLLPRHLGRLDGDVLRVALDADGLARLPRAG